MKNSKNKISKVETIVVTPPRINHSFKIKELKKQEGFWNLAMLGKKSIYFSLYYFS